MENISQSLIPKIKLIKLYENKWKTGQDVNYPLKAFWQVSIRGTVRVKCSYYRTYHSNPSQSEQISVIFFG